MCLEEMLCCEIPEGALFYGQTRRRERIRLTEEMRAAVRAVFSEMHDDQKRGYTPKVKPGAFCRACSLNELCLPSLCKGPSALAYIKRELEADEP